MNSENKIFLDILVSDRLKPEVSKEESDFHLRKTLENGRCHPDITRKGLNFELIEGKIYPLQKDKSIPERVKENILARGIDNKNVSVVRIIFTGTGELLNQICYDNGPINQEDKTIDNSHIRRSAKAEKWAQDTYNYAAKKWGKENVLSFIVHLDEENPHIHCNVLPIVDGEFNSDKMFGIGKPLGEENLKKWNTEYYEQVGKNL